MNVSIDCFGYNRYRYLIVFFEHVELNIVLIFIHLITVIQCVFSLDIYCHMYDEFIPPPSLHDVGSFLPPEADTNLTMVDFDRSFDEVCVCVDCTDFTN